MQERAARQPVQPILSWLFAGATFAVWVAMSVRGVSLWMPSGAQLEYWGANSAANLIVDHQWWGLVINAFVPIGAWHLCICLLGLLLIATTLERFLGPERFLILYCLSAVAGSLTSLAVHPNEVDAGGSGALFGLCAAAAVSRWLAPEATAQWPRRTIIAILSAPFALALFAFAPGVDNFANLGGALAGALLGALFERIESDEPSRQFSPLLAAALAVLFIAGGVAGWLRGAASAPIQVRRLSREALAAMQINDAEGALPLIERSLALEPKQAPMLKLRAEALERLQKFEEAEQACTALLEVDPRDAEVLTIRCETRSRLRKFDDAIADCEAASHLPISARRRLYIMRVESDVFLSKRDLKGALALADKVILADPSDQMSRLFHADVEMELEHFVIAEDEFRAATKASPRDPTSWIGLCRAQRERQAFKEAASSCARALALDSSNVYAHNALAELYGRQGNYELTIAQLNHALELNPRSPMLLNNRAWFQRMLGKTAAAQSDIAQALQLEPGNGAALGTACWIEMDLGRNQEALGHCKGAVAALPDDAIDEGMLLFIQGDKAGALEKWSAEIDRHPYVEAEIRDYRDKARNQETR